MPLLLVVDDDERDLERYSSLGQRAGLQVVASREGEAALHVVEDRATDIAAAIVLWELPGKVSGPQVLRVRP